MTAGQFADSAQCGLKALSRYLELDAQLPVPPTSKRTLVGRFHHRLMELAAKMTVGELQVRIEQEIAALAAQVAGTRELQKFGNPSGWDEVNQSAAAATSYCRYRSAGDNVDQGGSSVERTLESRDGVMIGRPDAFTVFSTTAHIREFKVGKLRNADGTVLRRHLDQVAFYASLVFDNFPVSVVTATLESLSGDRVDVQERRDSVEDFRARVYSFRNSVNEKIDRGDRPASFASPSAEACSHCPIQVACVAFEGDVRVQQALGDQSCIEGRVTKLSPLPGSTSRLQVFDEVRQREVSLNAPCVEVEAVSVGQRLVVFGLKQAGEAFMWSGTTSVFSSE